MGYSFDFIPYLSDKERTLFDSYYRELQSLGSKSLIIETGKILTKIKAMLPHSSYWQEFVEIGLGRYVNDAQANCFINLAKLYDNFGDDFADELNKLSVKSLIHLSHPIMRYERRLWLLSTAQEINLNSQVNGSDPALLTFEEFEDVISVFLKTKLFSHGILYDAEFGSDGSDF
jgi:hypothetical protein